MASQRRQTFEAETYPDPFARGGRTAHLGDQRAQRENNFENLRSNKHTGCLDQWNQMRSNVMVASVGPMDW